MASAKPKPKRAAAAPDLPILQIRSVARAYGGIRALDDCTFDVPAGRVTGLVGPNGAGKTTLFNVVSGFESAQSGSVLFEGIELAGRPAHQVAELGIGRTFQLTRVFARLTALENVMVAKKVPNSWLEISREMLEHDSALAERSLQFLHLVGLSEHRNALAGNLSYGQQKLLDIARTLATEPRLLLLDEPLAGVNPVMIRAIGEKIRQIADEGTTVLLIEHNLSAVQALCDHVVVMEGGAVIAQGQPELLRQNARVLEAYLGQKGKISEKQSAVAQARSSAASAFSEFSASLSPARASSDSLSVQNLQVRYGKAEVLRGVDLAVAPGDFLALIGANGAGKSTTLKAIAGLVPSHAGSVHLGAHSISHLSSRDRLTRGIAYVPQGAKVFPSLTVAENLQILSNDYASILPLFPNLSGKLSMRAGSLSGGEQQMLSIARALLLRPRFLLLDEPSMGLSPKFVTLVFELLAAVNASGVGILLVEQNVQQALQYARAGLVLEGGVIARTVSHADLSKPEFGRAYLGV